MIYDRISSIKEKIIAAKNIPALIKEDSIWKQWENVYSDLNENERAERYFVTLIISNDFCNEKDNLMTTFLIAREKMGNKNYDLNNLINAPLNEINDIFDLVLNLVSN